MAGEADRTLGCLVVGGASVSLSPQTLCCVHFEEALRVDNENGEQPVSGHSPLNPPKAPSPASHVSHLKTHGKVYQTEILSEQPLVDCVID